MRIIKAPLRVSLFGGGTDLPEFFNKYGCTIISFAINRYMYLLWNERPTGGCRLTYSQVEECPSLVSCKHTLVRETAITYGVPEPCTLSIISDVPKGTGLGSSSSLAVGLCHLVNAKKFSGYGLARTAYNLERQLSPVGCQDHLPATYGGMHIYKIGVGVRILPVDGHIQQIVENDGMLLYTERSRKANDILPNWKDEGIQRDIQQLAEEVEGCLNDSIGRVQLGKYLQQTMALKRRVPGVMDDDLLSQYDYAMDCGALGGKLLGAGAGGCWFFLVPGDSVRRTIRSGLGLREIPFRVAMDGVEERIV